MCYLDGGDPVAETHEELNSRPSNIPVIKVMMVTHEQGKH